MLESAEPTVAFRYVDRADTWAEFQEHFADEPDVLDLVGRFRDQLREFERIVSRLLSGD